MPTVAIEILHVTCMRKCIVLNHGKMQDNKEVFEIISCVDTRVSKDYLLVSILFLFVVGQPQFKVTTCQASSWILRHYVHCMYASVHN